MKIQQEMENHQDDILVKSRSYRGVIAAAYRQYTRQFVSMFKAVWIHILDTAVVTAAVGMLTAYGLYFLVPLAVLAVILEIVLWLMTARWLTKLSIRQLLRLGNRHWLLLIGIALAGIIALLPLCALFSLPLLVLVLAEWESQSSILMGDAQSMPSYMTWLSAAVWVLVAMLQLTARLFIIYVGYYACGSAEARHRERQEQRLNLQ